ncbi:MAG TPA: FHA domain-containing protein [Chthoniobacterales bacterium]
MPKLQIFLAEESPSIHDLPEEKVTVGRLPDNTLQISDESVSSHHAELTFEQGLYHLRDLGSTNGTFVNGEMVTDVILQEGDQIRFGKVESFFAADATTTSFQPPPETKDLSAEAGEASSRPENFLNTSPFPKEVRERDPLALAATVLAVIGVLGFAGSLYGIYLLMQAPGV